MELSNPGPTEDCRVENMAAIASFMPVTSWTKAGTFLLVQNSPSSSTSTASPGVAAAASSRAITLRWQSRKLLIPPTLGLLANWVLQHWDQCHPRPSPVAIFLPWLDFYFRWISAQAKAGNFAIRARLGVKSHDVFWVKVDLAAAFSIGYLNDVILSMRRPSRRVSRRGSSWE